MGEGGGFPQVRAVVSQVSPELPLACPNTNNASECELTNLLVGLMQVQVSEYLVPLPSLIPEPQHAPSTPSSAESWEQHQVPTTFALLHSWTFFGPNKELKGVSHFDDYSHNCEFAITNMTT
jgi:hypothetical protein